MSTRATYDTVAIVGVGLIGGSIGKALLTRGLAGRVIGVGRRTATLEAAAQLNLVTETTTDLAGGVEQAELVVVCTPVAQIAPTVLASAAAARAGTLLTDVGSTKQQLVAAIEESLPDHVAYVGSHPLAGNHESGPHAATDNLFVGRRTVVTPTPGSNAQAIEQVCAFWQRLGSAVTRLSPDEHDAALAMTSHVPHLLASGLAAVTPRQWLELTGPGWQDTTRIAAGNVDMWLQIVAQNRLPIARALDKLLASLNAVRSAVEQQDDRSLRVLLETGKETRDAVAN